MRRGPSGDERGVTLVELLMTITIMGLIIGPLSAGLIVGLRTAGDTATRLAGSSDAHFLTIALPSDIQSTGKTAGDVVVAPTVNTECSGVANRARFRWTTTDSGASVTYQAAYAVSGSAALGWKLDRYYCVGAATPVKRTVARNLASATSATAVISSTKVTMTIVEAKGAGTPTAYTFAISGYRRTP